MSECKKTGALGEELAAEYLMKKGYSVICRNYRARHGEIDLICENGEKLVFAEVKTRRKERTCYGTALSAVGYAKQSHLIAAAEEYLYDNREKTENLSPRIDVVEVYLTDGGAKIIHTENAVVKKT